MYHEIIQQKIENLKLIFEIIQNQKYESQGYMITGIIEQPVNELYDFIKNDKTLYSLVEKNINFISLEETINLIRGSGERSADNTASDILSILSKRGVKRVNNDLILAIQYFKSFILEPLYLKIISDLNSQQLALSVLYRYKNYCEAFDVVNKDLREQIEKYCNNVPSGSRRVEEDIIQPNLYKYLHEQGLVYFNEVQVVSGRVDFISQQSGQKFVGEVKLYKDTNPVEKAKLQIQDYLDKLNHYGFNVGYLVIYNLTDKLLTLPVNKVEKNGKIIYLIMVDIRDKKLRESASELNTKNTEDIEIDE